MAYQTYGSGLYQTAKLHSLLTRKRERLARPRQGIIYAPGLTGTPLSWQAGTEVNAAWLALAEYRYRICSFSEEIEWGNSAILTKLDNLYAYARANWGFRPRVHLFSASGGTPSILNWALAHPTQVAAICFVIGAVDIQDIHDNARTAAIGLPDNTYGPKVAYGGARPPDASNPADNTAALAATGIPIRMYYSTNDPVCVPATQTAFATATGAELISLGAQGHGSTGMTAQPIVDFYKTYAKHP